MKKLIGMLALVLLFTGCAGNPVSGNRIWVKDTSAKAGQTVQVEIYVAAEDGVAATDLEMAFDQSKVTYQEFAAGSAYSGTSECALVEDGLIHMTLITLNPPTEETLLGTVSFQVAEGVSGDVPLTLSLESCYNYDVQTIQAEVTDGKITVK